MADQQGLPFTQTSSADISADGLYRYSLTRDWGIGDGRTLWVMLNPSTADAEVDDPTIRRCIGFSHSWGRRSLTVVNLFALRATDPRELLGVDRYEAIGERNDHAILRAARDSDVREVVCAWGARGTLHDRSEEVRMLLRRAVSQLYCLATTRGAQPRHPLYLLATLRPRPWPPEPTP